MQSFDPSVSQKLIWLDQQLAKDSAKYNIGGYACLDGPLSYSVFNEALGLFLRSQEAYSSLFRIESGELICVVADAAAGFSIDTVDLSEEEDAEQAAIRWMEDDFRAAFQVEDNYLFSFKLLKIREQRHFWYAKMHHLISDGWSFKLLLNQVADIYDSLINGKEKVIASYRYSDFAGEDLEYYRSTQCMEDRKFWLEEYKALPSELFRRIHSGSHQAHAAGSHTIYLSADSKAQLKAYADSNKVSLFNLFIALLLVYFGRTRQQQEIAVGFPVLNRTKKVYRNTSGVFMNLLSLKFGMSDGDSLAELCNKVKSRMSGALRHQRYQYGNLVKDLRLSPGSPLYDIRVSYEEFEFASQFGDLTAHAVALSNVFEIDKLAIYLRDYHEQGFDVRFVYSEEYFDTASIQSIGASIEYIINGLRTGQEPLIGDMLLLGPEERAEILGASRGERKERSFASFLDHWEFSVSRYGRKAAVSARGEEYTYEEMNRRAREIADALKRSVTGDDRPIILLLPRSPKMISAILGSMMAGVAYIPLDGTYPPQRIRQIAENAGCVTGLVVDETEEYSSCFPECRWLNMDKLEMPGVGAEANAGTPVTGEKPCYIIYTSGSTGVPKGVVISHRSLADYVETFREYFQLTEDDVVLQQAPVSFDTSVEEIFPVLSSGGRLHILEDRRDFQCLLDVLSAERITILSTTPLVLNFLNDQPLPSSIRLLISGGDVLKPAFVNDLLRRNIPVYNTYGPTESTVCASYHKVRPGEEPIPLGRPMPNREIFILDASLHLQPFGVEGEICLGGEGLAFGYVQDVRLTNEKFIAHPFAGGGRIYRTGDTGILRLDGNILFAGRKDEQLSCRGYRIEAHEVERAIGGNSDIGDCLVTVREIKGLPLLVAYVKYKGEKVYSPREWKDELRDKLPGYMIPELWVAVEEFPLLPNGKVNRKALPEIDDSVLEFGKNKDSMPRTWLEHCIAGTWRKILGQESIGIEESFFDVGGHSLNIIQLINDYYRVFEVKLSVRELFDHTTIASQAALIAGKSTVRFSEIERAGEAADYAVSEGQRRLWVLSQVDEENRAYHLYGQLSFKGECRADHFEQALKKIVQRHEVLRTVFRENAKGELRQTVLPADELLIKITYKDLRGADPEKTAAHIRRESYDLFDLSMGPLWRAGLVRLADDHYIFHYTMHHIISDGWSMEVLKGELLRYYDSFSTDAPFELPVLRIQYRDYASWLRRQMEEEAFSFSKKYWLQQLGGDLPVLDMPSDRTRPPLFAHKGARLLTSVDRGLMEKLYAFSRQQNGTLFMGLFSILNVLLYRYTGQDDIIIGTPASGREHPELEDQIGFYVNTLALRTRFEGENTFAQLFGQVREVTLSAYENRVYPFDQLIGELKVRRDMSRSALFDIMLIVQNQQERSFDGDVYPVMDEDILDQGECAIKFDLTFDFREKADKLYLMVEFNTDIYDKETVVRLINHYKRLMTQAVQAPDARINEVDFLSSEERSRGLDLYSREVVVKYPSDKTVVDLFREQASKTPEHIAVVFEGRALTYGELDKRSDRLGNHLRRLGVARETLVPVCLERSNEMIVGILGILKSGGAYVPIDPDYPREHISYILTDINASLILTHSDQRELFDYEGAPNRIYIDEDWGKIERAEEGDGAIGLSPDTLAYIIYTSGSTGRPKGVMIEHGNLVRLFRTDPSLFDFSESDTWTLFHSYSFDFSVWEIFGALLSGGKLVIVSRDVARDTEAFADLLWEEGVTVLNQTPNAFYVLSKEMTRISRPRTIRYVIFGGEALDSARLREWVDAFPACRMVNMYGITETTVHVTYEEIRKEEIGDGVNRIGKAIPTLYIYLLDKHRNLVPIGVPGEICVGGAGLARGYLHREDITRERFIEDPFREGERLYLSGDQGKWLEEGGLEYLGRKDEQVKVRGYRIEPGEIENMLLNMPGIVSAVVLACGPKDGPRNLVAYIVSDHSRNQADLRMWLKERLPDHMIPSYFVQAEKIPMTPNGKVDKKALLSIESPEMAAGTPYIEPRTQTEMSLVEIYQQVLNGKRISVRDNFFDLGGNSMLLMKIRMEVRKQLGIDLHVREFYKLLTIEEVAAMIESVRWLQLGNKSSQEQEADLII